MEIKNIFYMFMILGMVVIIKTLQSLIILTKNTLLKAIFLKTSFGVFAYKNYSLDSPIILFQNFCQGTKVSSNMIKEGGFGKYPLNESYDLKNKFFYTI